MTLPAEHTEELPSALPTYDCPTCHRKESVALEEGQQTTALCKGCGKLLKIERGPGTQLVVIEQITPMMAVKPEGGYMPQRWAVTCKKCHGAAFVVIGDLPKPTDVVTAARCEHLDGRPLQGADPLACDSCGIDFTTTGVEPSDQWQLLPDTFTSPHDPASGPWGRAADPVDIASVRIAIRDAQPAPTPRPGRSRRRAERTESQEV